VTKTTAGSLLTHDRQAHPPTTQEERGKPVALLVVFFTETPSHTFETYGVALPNTPGLVGRRAGREREIRLMINSHKSQSEKLATGGGRETTAEKQ